MLRSTGTYRRAWTCNRGHQPHRDQCECHHRGNVGFVASEAAIADAATALSATGIGLIIVRLALTACVGYEYYENQQHSTPARGLQVTSH
jgi:hypothetical protein